MLPLRKVVLIAAIAAAPLSCETHRTPVDAGRPAPAGTIATVNGHPITQAEVQVSQRTTTSHGVTAETPQDTMNRLIQDEILAQRAVEMGLEQDPTFRDQDRVQAARYQTWRRQRLAELFTARESSRAANITDAEAHAFYDANAQRIRTQTHVFQLLMRDEAAAQQAATEIHGGTPFEDVAHRIFAMLPPTQQPWDLGWMRWDQIPEAWGNTLDSLQPGQVSDVISGPNRRFWILKVIERREVPTTFEQARTAIIERLQRERSIEVRTREIDDLRHRARIVIIQQPTASPRVDDSTGE